eukprot:c28746_g1_i1 orf=348-2288(-)
MIASLWREDKRFGFAFLLCWIASLWVPWLRIAGAKCIPREGCSVALAYYSVASNQTLLDIATLFQTSVTKIQSYNNISNPNLVELGQTVLVPFQCDCDSDQLSHKFQYTVQSGDTATTIAQVKYEFLSTTEWMSAVNTQDINEIYPNNVLNVPVNCSCGNPKVSKAYGLFATYVAEDNDSLARLSEKFNISANLLQQYNSVDLNNLQTHASIVFAPEKDGRGVYPAFNTSAIKGSGGISTNVKVGISVGASIALLALVMLGIFFYCFYLPKRHGTVSNSDKQHASVADSESPFVENVGMQRELFLENEPSNMGGLPTGFANSVVDKSVEFSYEELAAATDNFSIAKEIGRGGYGAVYYGELRGQKLAIKMMNMQATKEFLAELNVLTRVHHTNLVRLVGYCTANSLFVVYEYVDNGTLSQHLRASGGEGIPPLTWASRVQIALQAARGLEYIHEHTTPTYIHRDIKPSNILLDKNLNAKVADFGLTKLTESSGMSVTIPSRLVGTFGYMAPEYARFGEVSPKVDVYSFGVVLFEIISAKEAIVHNVESQKGISKGLVTLFEEVLNDCDGKEKLQALVDPALGHQYPVDAVWKMAQLAAACTREKQMLRPNMRAIVVALMTLASTTQEWETGSFTADQSLGTLVSGR